jgi:hypothetical protein
MAVERLAMCYPALAGKKCWECWARRPGAGCGAMFNGRLALSH